MPVVQTIVSANILMPFSNRFTKILDGTGPFGLPLASRYNQVDDSFSICLMMALYSSRVDDDECLGTLVGMG